MSDAAAAAGDGTREGDDFAAELPRRAADLVQQLADTIHDRALRPITLAARAVVFGLVILALTGLVAVVGSVALVRLLDVYTFAHRVWLSYIVVGGVLTLGGLALWSRRTTAAGPAR